MCKRSLWALLGVVLFMGCSAESMQWHPDFARAARDAKQAKVYEEQAEILALYKKCLQRKEGDPTVDCSEYRTALELNLKQVSH